MAIGRAGAANAAIFVAEMLAGRDAGIRDKLVEFRKKGCVL